MSTPYIPSKNALFQNWALNFSTVITANPGSYGLASGDATAIGASYASWHAAYLAATTPGTRTPVTVAAMAVAKAAALIVFRSYATIIGANAGVTNSAKTAAGLTVRATGRTPIPAPTDIPILGLVGYQPLVATLNYKPTASPTTKGKPVGTIQMEVWYNIPTTGSPNLSAAVFYGVVTKAPFVFNTPTGQTGKLCGVWGRWVTRRGLTGPFSSELDLNLT
jgi:hypothetical protein